MLEKKTGLALLVALSALLAPAFAAAEDAVDDAADNAAVGTLSLATNPQVMVYIDGHRVGMSPLLNHQLPVGEHRLSLLLIRADGQRLRAEYDAVIEAGQTTMASLNLVTDAPAAGEVRRIAPAPPVAVAQQEPAPPQETEVQTSRAPIPPVDVAAVMRTDPTVAADAPPQPLVDESHPVTPPPIHGLSRELVQEGMEALRPVVEQCMNGSTGLVTLRVVIQPDGGVTEVEAQGVYRNTDIGQCIERALPEEAAFPIYAGDPIPVVYPFRIND